MTAGLSSLVTGMAVHPSARKLQGARKLVAMLPAHRGVAVATAAVTISTELSPTQPSLTPRGAYSAARLLLAPTAHWQSLTLGEAIPYVCHRHDCKHAKF